MADFAGSLIGAGGAAGAGDAIADIQNQRLQAIKEANLNAYWQRSLDQQDALTRLKAQEQANNIQTRLELARQAEADQARARRAQTAQRMDLQLREIPTDQPLSGSTVQTFTDAGIVPERFSPQGTSAPAPPPAIAAPDDSGAPEPLPGTVANSPAPGQMVFHRIPTTQEVAQRRLVNFYPINSPQRAALEYEMATGKNAPTSFNPQPKAPKPPTAEEDVQHYLTVLSNRQLGNPVTPEDDAFAKAYEKNKTLVPTANFNLNQPQRNDQRFDRSYDARSKELENLRKPIADRADKIGELEDLLNQNTPQADALVAPKLLSTTVGGQGSGLRMTEPELQRVMGGVGKWNSLKAAMQQWSTDPKAASSLTPEQRQQIRTLIAGMKSHVSSKLDAVDAASDGLIAAPDVESHRRIVSDLRRTLDAGNAQPGGGTIRMKAPNGQISDVAPDQVDHYRQLGAVVVR